MNLPCWKKRIFEFLFKQNENPYFFCCCLDRTKNRRKKKHLPRSSSLSLFVNIGSRRTNSVTGKMFFCCCCCCSITLSIMLRNGVCVGVYYRKKKYPIMIKKNWKVKIRNNILGSICCSFFVVVVVENTFPHDFISVVWLYSLFFDICVCVFNSLQKSIFYRNNIDNKNSGKVFPIDCFLFRFVFIYL